MNNREAYEFLALKGSVRVATTDFLQCFDLEEESFIVFVENSLN